METTKEQKRKEKEGAHSDKKGVETKTLDPKDIKLLSPKLLRPQGANSCWDAEKLKRLDMHA